MARSLKSIEPGHAWLVAEVNPFSDEDHCEDIFFDAADWRFELGSRAANSSRLKFDPALCALAPEEIGFTPGWSTPKS